MNSLEGKVAVITGATSGIGEATVKRFVRAGAIVVMMGRNQAAAERIMRELNNEGYKQNYSVFFHEMDLQSDDSIYAAVEFVRNRFQSIDILFNNAGIFPVSSPFDDITRHEAMHVIDTNVMGIFVVIKRFFKLFNNRGGVILNNASIAGMQSYTSGQSYFYSMSKAAILKLTQMLAKQYGQYLRVNAVCPGVIRTPIFKTFDEERFSASIPMHRVGEPEEVAAVANFLCSDDASYINGAVLTIDGGQSL